jgi:hypothetical protein
MNNKNQLIKEGFVKICDKNKNGGCVWVHPDGRRVKLYGNRIIKLKN